MEIKVPYSDLRAVPSLTILGLHFNVRRNFPYYLLNIAISGNKGGAFKVSGSKLYLVKSEFIQNYAVEGGVIY